MPWSPAAQWRGRGPTTAACASGGSRCAVPSTNTVTSALAVRARRRGPACSGGSAAADLGALMVMGIIFHYE